MITLAEVHLPGVGKMPKGWLYAVAAASVAVVGYAWWQHKKNGTAAAATDTTAAADPSIDPTTGLPYASEYGSGYAATGYTGGSYIDPTTGAYIGGGLGPSTPSAPTTNAAWAQQAEAYLAQVGYNGVTVAAAIGKALTGQHVTADQAAIVQAAIGFEGQPPQGMPPLSVSPPAGQPGPPKALGKPTGLKVTKSGQTYISLDWAPVSGATGYEVSENGRHLITVTYSNYSVPGLKKNTSYKIGVKAIGGGKTGPEATITVRTHK